MRKNPLRKRYLRDLRSEAGKYSVIFLFMVMLIGVVSGFLVTDKNFLNSYKEGFTKYNVEDGYLAFNREPEQVILEELEEKGALKFYDLRYFEEHLNGETAKVRVYKIREEINTACLMSGAMPEKADEIALDRMFAENAKIKVGDTITLHGHELKVSGVIALVDYSCLFEKNTDMMFDSINFGVGIMTPEGFDATGSTHLTYNYGWQYTQKPENDVEENTRSEVLIETLREVLQKNGVKSALGSLAGKLGLSQSGESKEMLTVTDYVPRYANKAINFTGEDFGSDATMITVFYYMVIVIMAFLFAVIISGTIAKEAGAIGTLRATGYTRGELIRHYLAMPMAVTVAGGIVGNALGYTAFVDMFIKVYYGSYSLASYEPHFRWDVFVQTTVVTFALMLLINLWVLTRTMHLTPLQFLRRELSKKKKRRAVIINKKLPFMLRFRMRILFQNIPAYLTMMIGIMLGGTIMVFGLMFTPLFKDYKELVTSSKIADYQYVLMEQMDTAVEGAEKYCVTELDMQEEGYVTDSVMVYGISDNSRYIHADLAADTILVSNGMAIKYHLSEGDTISLTNHYTGAAYTFTVGGEYTYDAALAVFMNRETYLKTFEQDADYFTGYLSNEELSDIPEDSIATVITEKDLRKLADQMLRSMGEMMNIFKVFGVIMFMLIIYLMTKQIIEKNQIPIAMTKILGFKDKEISSLYLAMSFGVALAGLLISVPLIHGALYFAFTSYIYKVMSGYIPFIVSGSCYVKMIALGIVSFIAIGAVLMRKIGRIPKSEALKNVE